MTFLGALRLLAFSSLFAVGLFGQSLGSSPLPADATLDQTLQKNLKEYHRWTYHERPTFDVEAFVKWSCYVHTFTNSNGYLKPYRRTSAWFVGELETTTKPTLLVDLLHVGAHHRLHPLYVRVAEGTSGAIVGDYPGAEVWLVEQIYDALGQWVREDRLLQAKLTNGEFKGFYLLRPSGRYDLGKGKHIVHYELNLPTGKTSCVLQAAYLLDPPGRGKRQPEDGGPPPPDPSQEDP